MFFRKKEAKKSNRFKQILNLATLISIALATIKLAYYDIITIEIAGLILVATVILLAIGNGITKLIIAIFGVYVFLSVATKGYPIQFEQALTYFIVLVIVLFGIYVMFGGFIRK